MDDWKAFCIWAWVIISVAIFLGWVAGFLAISIAEPSIVKDALLKQVESKK